jgi:predicted CopG family antitoxin
VPRINIEIKDGIHQKLVDQCQDDGRSVSDVIRALILEFVERRAHEKMILAEIIEKEGYNVN